MTIRKLTTATAIGAFFATAFATGFALAADEAPAAPAATQTASGGPGGAAFEDQLFKQYDTDKNGEISRQEVDAVREARVKAMDSNGDGKVSPEERRAYMQHQMQERRSKEFAALDTNHDGQIQLDEYQAQAAKRFARLDRDNSGGLTQAELAPRRGGGNRN